MTRREQHELIQELAGRLHSMSREDREATEMLRKRDRDDEDLDRLSQAKLEALAAKYLPKPEKKDLDALLRKMIERQKEQSDDT